MTTKEEIHRLIDRLPESELVYAKGVLEDLLPDTDDDHLTAEELAEIEVGEAEIGRGEYITQEELDRKYRL